MSNIVLIGMPGAGKSTVGVLLAKELRLDFIDTDILIQNKEQRTLQTIVDDEGYLALRDIEAHHIQSLNVQNTVIATGGSAVYSNDAMRHLQQTSRIVFLDVSFAALLTRIKNFESRGIAASKGVSFNDVFNERFILYNQYANLHINCDQQDAEETLQTILNSL